MFLRLTRQRRKYEGFVSDRKVGDWVYHGIVLSSFREGQISRHRYIGTLFNVSDRELIEMTRPQATRFYLNKVKRMKSFGANESELAATTVKLKRLLRLTEFSGQSLEGRRCSISNTYHYKRKGTSRRGKPYSRLAEAFALLEAYSSRKAEGK